MALTAPQILSAFSAAGFADEAQLAASLTVMRIQAEISDLQAQLTSNIENGESEQAAREVTRQSLQDSINAKLDEIKALQP